MEDQKPYNKPLTEEKRPWPESDADKLRFLATYFDAQTEAGLWDKGNREVQEDLLRIARLLETHHEAFLAVLGSSSLRMAWQIAEESLK